MPAELRANLVRQMRQIDVLAFQAQALRGQAGDVQHLLDEQGEPVNRATRLGDELHHALLAERAASGPRDGPYHQVRLQLRCGERRPELVGSDGDEVVPEL